MFSENLKTIRKAKGLSQEELAVRLHVVRQTVSKWEKGLSVPDAEMLIRLADTFEVSVSALLGGKFENETDSNGIAEQLSRINEQLAVKNRRGRFVLKLVLGVLIGAVALGIILSIVSFVSVERYRYDTELTITELTGDDEPAAGQAEAAEPAE